MTPAQNLQPFGRPRLTLKILGYVVFDMAGMIALATGALWLARGQTLFIAGFPTNLAEALAAVVGGLALMLWAAAQILRELMRRPTGKT
ncbi:MAG: hypothetical protein H6R17_1266 [Proteobacteria bacterium]|nr:hypothetical protein [Pseudomonadota bacterium]